MSSDSFFNNLCAEELAEGHEEYTGHSVMIKVEEPRDDGKVLAYCIHCAWEEWGEDLL